MQSFAVAQKLTRLFSSTKGNSHKILSKTFQKLHSHKVSNQCVFGRWEYWLLFSRHKYPWHLIQQEREAMFHMGLDLLLVFTNADNLPSAVDQNCLLQCVPSAGIHYYNTHHVFFPPSSIVMLLTRTLKLNRFFTFEFLLASLKCFFPKVHVTTHKMKNNFDRNFQARLLGGLFSSWICVFMKK